MTGGGQQRSDQVHLECDSITIVVIIVLASSTKIIMISLSLREAFKKNNDKTYGKFHIFRGGGGQQRVIFHILSRNFLNAQKAILSIFRLFYFFPYVPPPSTTILWAK